MTQYGSFDPATGQPGAGFPAPGGDGSRAAYADRWAGEWSPNTAPEDPHNVPFSVGDEGTVDPAPVPPNVVTDAPGINHDFTAERSLRAADPHDADRTDGDDAPDGSFDDAWFGDFDPNGGDGDDDPHDQDTVDTSDGNDDCADCGEIAENILTRGRGGWELPAAGNSPQPTSHVVQPVPSSSRTARQRGL
jgi:hypothetical protein